jgi:hypothetical protein
MMERPEDEKSMNPELDERGYEYAAGEVTLPFAYEARISSAPRPPSLDFPDEPNPDNSQVLVRIEGELWQFRCPWIMGKPIVVRYRGPDIDHLARVEDGSYPPELTTCWFLGGMWYAEAERKLYAPMHVEQAGPHRQHPVDGWPCRKIVLATSLDKGRTWAYAGDIISPATYYYNHDAYKFAGACYGNGVGDFGFYADVRGGYFYIFSEEGWFTKGKFGAAWSVRAARRAMSDRMAPGAWRYFYNGAWDEPALGGKSSGVAPSHLWGVIYSTRLQRYICMLPSNSDPVSPRNIDGVLIGTCGDLAKQDWVWGYCPEAMFGFMNLLNAEGNDLTRCDQSFRHYAYGPENTFRRVDITLSPGETRTLGVPPRYTFEPHPESSDAVVGRQTRIVGARHPETVCGGAWVERRMADSYEGLTLESASGGDSVEFSFVGADVYWRAVRSPESGKADVYLDGVWRKTVDCYSPQSTSCEQFAYIRTGLDPQARHTLKIVVRGEKHPQSRGAAIGHIAFEHAAESYKASAGFCSVMGKNGWHYQQWDGRAYTDLRFIENDLAFTNYWFGDGSCVVGDKYQIPDAHASVRKWLAPHGGIVRVEGSLKVVSPGGDGVMASIVRGGSELWPARLVTSSQPALHDQTVEVRPGDALCFTVAKARPRAAFDRVVWDPVITYLQSRPGVWQPNLPSGRNLAQGAYARSKVFVCTYRPFDAVDGSPDTAFVIHPDDPLAAGHDWLMLDLHTTCRIDQYIVLSRPEDPAYRPAEFALQQSADGFAWTEVDRVTGNVADRVERTVPAFDARYVRLYFPKGKPFAINEFELRYTEAK